MGINRVNTDTMLKSAFNLLFLLGCGRACIIIVVIPVQQQSSTPAITTTTTTTTTTAAAGRKKRSADECSILETYEAMAFQYCDHSTGGFTWDEAKRCEEMAANIPLLQLPFEMPSKSVFNMIEGTPNGDGDGVLTWEEWLQYVGCD